MERKNLESAAVQYRYLQGLLAVPVGLWCVLAGLSRLVWREAQDWVVLGGAVLGALAYVRIARYYKENYGRVTPARSRRVKDAVLALLSMAVIVGFAALDVSLDLPVSGYMAAFAGMMLVYAAGTVGLKTHHLLIWGALLVAGLLPIWGGFGSDGDVPVALLPMGAGMIAVGLFDHSLLTRTFGSSNGFNLRNSNAGA